MESRDDALQRHHEPLRVSVVSLQGGTGRTSTMVNLAWTLAASGLRVLVVDADVTAPRAVEGYLSCLPSATPSEGMPGLRRFRLPGGIGAVDAVQTAESSLQRVLDRARGEDYDVVLTDHAVLRADGVATIASACDVALLCFRPIPDQPSRTWAVGESLRRQSGERVRVVLAGSQLPGRTAHDHLGRLARQIDDAVAMSSVPPGGPSGVQRGIQLVRMPYRPFKPDTALSPLTEGPGVRGGVLEAYRTLAEAVLGSALLEPRPVPAHIRRRYLASLRLVADEGTDWIGVLYLPRDRAWAEWIAAQIDQCAGLRSQLLPVDNRRLAIPNRQEIVVVTGRVPGNNEEVMLADAIQRAHDAGVSHLVSVSIRRDHPPHPVEGAHLILRVGRQSEQEVRASLRAALGLFGPTTGPSAGSFPGSGSQYPPSLPIRNPDFLGRGAELEIMRDRLLERPYAQWVISGEGGTGKSEIACEYAHRFVDSYEVVWWIPAQSRGAVRRGLTALARQLMNDVGADPASAAVTWLSGRIRPWLLIFDNADDLDVLRDMVPRAPAGHVVVTTRQLPQTLADSQARPDDGDEGDPRPVRELPAGAGREVGLAEGPVLCTKVGEFDVADAVLVVLSWLPSLGPDQATRLAELVGRLPIALRLAVAWASETAAGQVERGLSEIVALNQCVDRLVELLGQRIREIEATVEVPLEDPATAAMLTVTLGEMDHLGGDLRAQRSAVRLAQMCSFLSPDGVSLTLLCSAAMLRGLSEGSGDEWLLEDGVRLHQVLWVGHRYGVFEINRAAQGQLRMHRMIGSLLRATMPAPVRQERCRQVLDVLSAFVPSDAEGDAVTRSENLAELADHLEPSGALTSNDWAVRRWVVAQLRYAYRWGDVSTYEDESTRAAEVAERWRAEIGQDDALYLRLLVQRANLERGLGRFRSALDLDTEALQIELRTFGTSVHPRTLITRRGLAADLRGMGQFNRALTEDHTVYEGFREVFGPDHSETLMAAHNLVLSQVICGRVGAVAPVGQRTADQWRRVYGAANPNYVKSMIVQAFILRELGLYVEAEQTLYDTLRDAQSAGMVSVVDDLVLASSRAISLRATGNPADARRQHHDVLDSCLRILGPHHQVSLTVQVALAMDHHALGDHAEAIRLGEEAVDRYAKTFPSGHPFVGLCRANLAVFLRDAGQTRQAVKIGDEARTALDRSLGDIHPWTLGADLNQANHLAVAGAGDDARQLRAAVIARCVEPTDLEHPVIAKAKLQSSAGDQFAGAATDILFEVPVL